jgi:hypothetical protein
VWVGHLRRADPRLIELLESGDVLLHPRSAVTIVVK